MSRATRITLLLSLALGLLAVAGPASALTATRVEKGLNAPTAFTFSPTGNIWYGERGTGEIHVIKGNDNTRFFTIERVSGAGERGLLGLALHPDFAGGKPFLYAYVTRSVGGTLRNQIVRLRNQGGHGEHLTVIWSSPASNSPYHNGGRILFGPDGMLYAVVGEGHDPAQAQVLSNGLGKILRMTPLGDVPGDNPIADSRIYAYGIRNSFGFAFDPQTDDIWETENGPACVDEINLIAPGANYGWGPSQTCAGMSPGNTNSDGPSPVLPLVWYTPTIAPTGIAFCEGCGLGVATEGTALFAAFNDREIHRLTLNPARDDIDDDTVVYPHPDPIFSVEPAPNGRVFFSAPGSIWRLTP